MPGGGSVAAVGQEQLGHLRVAWCLGLENACAFRATGLRTGSFRDLRGVRLRCWPCGGRRRADRCGHPASAPGAWLCLELPGPHSPSCLACLWWMVSLWECSCFLGARCRTVSVGAAHLWGERRLAACPWPRVLPTSARPSGPAGWGPEAFVATSELNGVALCRRPRPGAGWTLALWLMDLEPQPLATRAGFLQLL